MGNLHVYKSTAKSRKKAKHYVDWHARKQRKVALLLSYVGNVTSVASQQLHMKQLIQDFTVTTVLHERQFLLPIRFIELCR